MADRVCVMSAGRNEQTATPAELYARPATAFVAQFVGISSRLPVEATGNDVVLFGRTCPIRSGGAYRGTPIDALLRPEEIAVEADEVGPGVVTHKSFLGATTRLAVEIGATVLRVDVRSDVAVGLELGMRVRADVIARDVLVAPRQSADGSVVPGVGTPPLGADRLLAAPSSMP